MAADEPRVGQVVDHHFLWEDDRNAGLSEARKPRPCLIIAVERIERHERVTLLPFTSQPQRRDTNVLPVPNTVAKRIGLDPSRQSWLVLDEANVFIWPGYDLVPQHSGRFTRGTVTAGFFQKVIDAVVAVRSRGRLREVDRKRDVHDPCD
jgi:hypothetical protein